MQFRNNANDQDIVTEVLRICGTDVNSYPLADITRRCNFALDRFTHLALISNGLWQFDDLNESTLPIGTTNLFSGQYDYSFADDVLTVEKVLIKDPNGNWSELKPVDIDDSKSTASNIWTRATSSGTPTVYDKFANSILLDPTPNYNSSSGLKVVFQRRYAHFSVDDDTRVPGIPLIFHYYIARYAALQWLIENSKPQKNDIAAIVQNDEDAIKDFFSLRGKDVRRRLVVKQESNR